MYILTMAQAQALAKIAPTKDIRFYINGIAFQTFKDGRKYAVATDGAVMVLLRLAGKKTVKTPLSTEDPETIIVPTIPFKQAMALAENKRHGGIIVTTMSDGLRVNLSRALKLEIPNGPGQASAVADVPVSITAERVEGKFPDWRRIVPQQEWMSLDASCTSSLNPELWSKLCGAYRVFYGRRATPPMFTDDRGMVTIPLEDGIGVIMPTNPGVKGFKPLANLAMEQ